MIAVCIHGIQPVIVIRIGKINGSVFLTKQAGIVKVSGSISVDIACVVFDLTFLMAVKAYPANTTTRTAIIIMGKRFS